MKRYTFLLIIILGLSSLINAQEWVWSNSLSSTGEVYPSSNVMIDLVVDDDNNIYQTGFYNGAPLTIGNDITLPNAGNWDGFICKYSSDGTLLWANSLAGTNRDQVVAMEIVDNYLYVIGAFKDADIYFTPTDFLTNFDHYDIFLAKYDLDGNFIKATRVFWGPDSDRPRDMLYDPVSKKLVVIGNYKMEISYEDETLATVTVDTSGTLDKELFIATLDTAGFVYDFYPWILTNSNSTLKSLNWGYDTSYYVSGDLTGAIYFDVNDSIKGDEINSDAMVIKIDKNLNKEWAIKGGGTGFDHANSAASDNFGNIFITGKAEGTITFDLEPDGAQSSQYSTQGLQDMFFAKYNSLGTLQWLKLIGSSAADVAFGLAISENVVQFCGNYGDTLIFNTDTLTTINEYDINTGFAIYDLDGNAIGAQSISGDSLEIGLEIAFAKDGSTIISGYTLSDPLTIGDSVYATPGNIRNGFISYFKYPFTAFFSDFTEISCPGGNDGELTATTYFGVGPYTYDWSSPDTNTIENTGAHAFNLAAGSYQVTITDSKGQIASTAIYNLIDPNDFSILIDSTNLNCFESSDGSITPTVTGGTGPYNYAWSGPSGDDPNAKDQVNLTAGKYYLTVTDANSCQTIDSVSLIQPDDLLFGNVVVVGADPVGTGSIDLDVSGGTGAYIYAWVFNTTDSLIGRTYDTLLYLDEGDYTAYVTDDNLCQSDTLITVPGENLRVNLAGSDVSCFNFGDGTAYATIISGRKSFPFVYTFEDEIGTPISPVNDSIIQNLIPGKYFVTATEQGGEARIAMDSVTISQPDTLALSLDADSVYCYNGSNGSITLTVTGGVESYEYLWSNSSVSKNLTNIPAGWYVVDVTDANMCTTTDSVEVEQPDSFIVSILVDQYIKCFGQSSGRLLASVSGGNPTFSYQWDDPGNQTNVMATNLFAGTYGVVVTDIKGCINNASVKLTDPLPFIFASVDTNNVSCLNANDGSISVTMAGGETPYTYSWNQAGLGNTNTIENLFPILYELTVTDANGCTNDSLSFVVKQPDTPLTIEVDDKALVNNLCNGGNIGELAVNAAGGWGNYTFSRDLIDWQDSPEFTGLVASKYTVSAKDTFGCVVGVDITITEPEELALNVSSSGSTIDVEGQGGTGPYTYAIDGGVFQAINSFIGLTGGSHIIEVTDANDCGPVSQNINLTSVELNELNKFLDIYPNPSSGMFNLEFNIQSDSELLISVYSVVGSRVYTNSAILSAGPAQIISIDLTDQQAGVYLLEINGIMLDKKLIVE